MAILEKVEISPTNIKDVKPHVIIGIVDLMTLLPGKSSQQS